MGEDHFEVKERLNFKDFSELKWKDIDVELAEKFRIWHARLGDASSYTSLHCLQCQWEILGLLQGLRGQTYFSTFISTSEDQTFLLNIVIAMFSGLYCLLVAIILIVTC